MSEKLIDDFEDVSKKEKQFMKLWNRYIRCHHVIADRDIPWKVERFILTNREKLKEGDLRMNLLLHLSNLWDFGLISSRLVSICMMLYDDGEMPSRHDDDWVRLYVCDVCKMKGFESLEEATEHESKCTSSSGKSSR